MTTLNIHRIPKFVVNIATVIAHGGFNIGVAHHLLSCARVNTSVEQGIGASANMHYLESTAKIRLN